jgi:dipeptidyl aminopeptidase/acylaminoacyl peptidase
VLVLFAAPLTAQDPLPTDAVYRVPSDGLVSIIDAPPTPGVSLAPNRDWMVLMHRPGRPSIAELAEPELRLAGIRIKPTTNGPSRSTGFNGLTFKEIGGAAERPVTGIPVDGRISDVRWSPDGSHIAFLVTTAPGIELWIAPVGTGQARRLIEGKVNDTYGTSFSWLSDNRRIVATMVPSGRGEPPAEDRVPTGPTIQQNLGELTPARTYQDLLQNARDENLFDFYFTSQLVVTDLNGRQRNIGEPGIFPSVGTSPNGEYVLVQQLHRPYSYQVPASRFPRLIEVWDLNGDVVHTVADLPLADNIPLAFGSVAPGPRSVNWRADVPATLVWADARDGGDAAAPADIRDELFALRAPFTGQPVSLAELDQRYAGVIWGNGSGAILYSSWWQTRNQKGVLIDPDNPSAEQRVLFDFSYQDRYNNPGFPITEPTEWGTSVLRTSNDGRYIYLSGPGGSDEGDRPFLDRMDLRTGETERLFRSAAPYYEYPFDIVDDSPMTLLTSRQSRTEPANFFLRTVGAGDPRPITDFPHPYPEMLEVSKELVKYERADGISLSGTLYLPPGYQPSDGPLPTLFWAYPTEYKSADAAGQVQSSPYQFTYVGAFSPIAWVLDGYAVFDDPQLPIIGEGEVEPNDTYVEQLVSGAQAAIDVLVERGVTDPSRTAIGGHSYGAFMTANLLAHSDLFRAGIARSGAYNRTLTPFGFQAEERKFWDAPEVYFAMSPFMHAEKIDEPMLMIHGEADNNSGTFPLQSERMFAAMKGLGGTARLVMLPYESHGYQARESVMHMMWETTEWLDRYVKHAPPRHLVP